MAAHSSLESLIIIIVVAVVVVVGHRYYICHNSTENNLLLFDLWQQHSPSSVSLMQLLQLYYPIKRLCKF